MPRCRSQIVIAWYGVRSAPLSRRSSTTKSLPRPWYLNTRSPTDSGDNTRTAPRSAVFSPAPTFSVRLAWYRGSHERIPTGGGAEEPLGGRGPGLRASAPPRGWALQGGLRRGAGADRRPVQGAGGCAGHRPVP